jgi:tetratricopeptide (TPR) repeat protein
MWCTLLVLLHGFIFSSFGQTIPNSISSNPHISLAADYIRKGQPELAGREYDIAIRQAAKGDQKTYGHVLDLAAAFFHEMGNFPSAESCLRKSLEIWRARLGPEHIALVPVVNRLACVYIEAGQPGKVERLQLEKWIERVAQQAPASPEHINLLGTLATHKSQRRRYDEAEQLSRTALDLLTTRGEADSMDSVAMINNLGLVSLEAGKLEQAGKYLRRAADLLEKSPVDHAFYKAVNMTLTARLYQKEKRFDESERLLRQALVAMEERCGPNSLRTALLLVEYANLLRDQKRKGEAQRVELRARNIIQASGMAAFSTSVDVADLRARPR